LKIKIKKIINTSLIDWEGKIVSTFYFPHCNFRCPFCYNCDLVLNPNKLEDIPIDDIKSLLLNRRKFIDGVCISGGEPTLCTELPRFLKMIKKWGFLIKLDTNGTNPNILKSMIDLDLIDYIAMDIKSSLDFENYSKSVGVREGFSLERIQKSIALIMNSKIDYEFRTTIVPSLHDEEHIIKIAKHIKGAKKYILQKFVSQEKMLDPSFQNVEQYSDTFMQQLREKIQKYVFVCSVR